MTKPTADPTGASPPRNPSGADTPLDRATAVNGAPDAEDDADGQGRSSSAPVEGDDKTAPPDHGSPQG